MPLDRLQKILSAAGIASRRRAEELISSGRVKVDGKLVTELGAKADPKKSRITVDGKPVQIAMRREYWMLNKPAGVISTRSDPQGRRRVIDLLPPEAAKGLYPVGRLDLDSEGLILLTNHGELAQRLTHPRYQVPKYYKAWVQGWVEKSTLNQLRQGVELEDGEVTAPARVYVKAASAEASKLNITLFEGKKREIRRMCRAVGHQVHRLVRVGLGPLKLGNLPKGQARPLRPKEVALLLESVGLGKPESSCKPRGIGVKKTGAQGKARKRKQPQRKK